MPDPRDPVDWIKHLEGPEPPAAAPEWGAHEPRRTPRVVLGVGLAMAAAALVWVALRTDSGTRLRGGAGAVDLDLRIVAITDAGPQRLRAGEVYPTGQALAFRLGATPESTVTVWAEGPGGRTVLGTHGARPTPADVEGEEGLLLFALDRPGRWTVYASTTDPGDCPPDTCTSRVIDVAGPRP